MRTKRARFHRVAFLAALFLLGAVFLAPGRAGALVGDTEGPFGLDGSLRSIGAVLDNYDFPPFFREGNEFDEYSQTLLRLVGAGRPSEKLSYEVHLVGGLTYFSGRAAPGSGPFDLGAKKTRYRALDETWDFWTEDRWSGAMWLDRCNFKVALPKMDITLGRQAITFGKAYFWNPLDVYLPFDPRQFDRDYKAGVDAARVDIQVGNFSGINLVGVLGRELDATGGYVGGGNSFRASWYGSSVLGRFFLNIKGWDLALQAGKVYGGYQVGGGLVGDIKGVSIRGEAAYLRANDSPPLPAPLLGDLVEDRLTGVAGLGYRFQSSLDLEFEYLYNGGGERDDLNTAWARFSSGAIPHLNRHLVGLNASYEFLPILTGQVAAIQSLTDSSTQVQPSLTLSLSDNAALIVGGSVNFGKRPRQLFPRATQIRSEFGTFPNFFYGEIKIYF